MFETMNNTYLNYQKANIIELPFFDKLIGQLEQLNWNEVENAMPQVAHILSNSYESIESLKEDLANISREQYSQTIAHSADLSSHKKFFVYRSEQQKFSIWINQFKTERKSGFANSIHNHRYWFASVPLKGGFIQNIHDRLSSRIIKTERIEQGKAYYISPNAVHSFDEIFPETVTLLVRSRAYFPYSESYDEQTETVKRHYSLASKIDEFKFMLK
jgi:predicted metal-dependent enzyme (double-stranded beta helix superfamily)